MCQPGLGCYHHPRIPRAVVTRAIASLESPVINSRFELNYSQLTVSTYICIFTLYNNRLFQYVKRCNGKEETDKRCERQTETANRREIHNSRAIGKGEGKVRPSQRGLRRARRLDMSKQNAIELFPTKIHECLLQSRRKSVYTWRGWV